MNLWPPRLNHPPKIKKKKGKKTNGVGYSRNTNNKMITSRWASQWGGATWGGFCLGKILSPSLKIGVKFCYLGVRKGKRKFGAKRKNFWLIILLMI